MASVALAGPPRVNDNLQTGPTVYKSGTLGQSTIRAFFCNISSLHLGHWMGFSRDIWIAHRIILQNATGSENLFLTRNAWCASRAAFWKSVSPCHDPDTEFRDGVSERKVSQTFLHRMLFQINMCNLYKILADETFWFQSFE